MSIKSESHFPRKLNVLLAEDDKDDRLFFEEALAQLPVPVNLSIVYDGEQLMEQLTQRHKKLPHVLFLDLSMPRKNGFACLLEIKLNEKLQKLPVIVLSTHFDEDMLNLVYKDAAHYYIQKPTDMSKLKTLIFQALTLIFQNNSLPGKEKFVLSGE